MRNILGRVVAAALIAAGALSVLGGVAAANSDNVTVAVECPPEKERC